MMIQDTVFCAGKYDMKLTISLGVACGNPLSEDSDQKFPLLLKADTAVYDAKNSGRNRINIWNAELLPPKKKSYGMMQKINYFFRKSLFFCRHCK